MKRLGRHVLILGSARSGTSWICESLARPRRHRLLFEPEHPDHVTEGKLIADRWFDEGIFSPDALHFLTRVFHNRIDNDWVAQHSYRKFKVHLIPFLPRYFVIKMVRGNLLIPAILNTFEMPVVYITRHPFAAIHSMQKVRFPWLYDLSAFQRQMPLMEMVRKRTGIDPFGELSNLERLALRWGIENLLVEWPEDKHLRQYRYEDLKKMGDEMEDMVRFSGMELTKELQNGLKAPSSKMRKKSTALDGRKQESLSDDEQQEVAGILRKFPYKAYDI